MVSDVIIVALITGVCSVIGQFLISRANDTETTEQTTPHSLHSYDGTTVVEASTEVDPVTLEVEYAAQSA